MNTISVIVPCYNEAEAIPLYYEEMRKLQTQRRDIRIELLFVDDGSVDESLQIMKELAKHYETVEYIALSRNFGKEGALYAGLSRAQGEYVAVMDVDLQDPPRLLGEMYDILQEGEYDCVATKRGDRKGEPKIRSFFANTFYKMINKMSETEIVNGARDYRLMRRKMVDAVLSMSEVNRFSKGIFSWVGFRTKWLEYENTERCAGETKWSFWKLFRYSLEGITGFSVAPLYLSSIVGILFFLLSFLMIGVIVVRTLVWGDPVAGWPSMVCILFFIGGIQLFCIGILGQYLSKTYLEAKHRPVSIVRESSLDAAGGAAVRFGKCRSYEDGMLRQEKDRKRRGYDDGMLKQEKDRKRRGYEEHMEKQENDRKKCSGYDGEQYGRIKIRRGQAYAGKN